MLIDRPQVVEGSYIVNPTVPVGTSDPANPNPGELFFRTDLNVLRIYGNSAWAQVADGAAFSTHVNDDTRHLTASQNTLIDGITVTSADINSIPTLTSSLATLTGNFNTHTADDSRHLTSAQNTWIDAITATSTQVNYLVGVTSPIQTQIDGANTNANNRVLRAGDTMTGDLSILKNSARMTVSAAASAQNAAYLLSTAGSVRWTFYKDESAESGSNAGSNLTINRYTDAGATIGAVLSFNRQTGNATFGSTVSAPSFVGPVTGAVTGAASANVLKSGDTMSGALTMNGNKVTSSATPTATIDLTNKSYVDAADYLNNNPKAGLLSGDSQVPIYSDFKFSLGQWGSSSFMYIDRDSKQVIYFHTSTPTGKPGVFRGYRFSDSDGFIYDNNQISATFLNAGEMVTAIANVGTYFVYLRLGSTSAPWGTTRWVLARTNGSSKWQDWTLAYDVTSLATAGSGTTNFYLLQDSGGDRILRMTQTRGNGVTSGNITLDVYNAAQTLLRTQVLMNVPTDVSFANSSGNTGGNVSIGYNSFGTAFGFTWNPVTQTLHQKNSGYYQGHTPDGTNYGQDFALSISWSIPRTWLVSGVGTPTNLVPIKSSTFRYMIYPDATWDTETGGMSTGYGSGGQATTLVTDEYSGNMHLTSRSTFTSNDVGSMYRLAATTHQFITFGNSMSPYIQNGVGAQMPDGSAWSKQVHAYFGQIVGNNIMFDGYSARYGSQRLTASFSTTQFNSAARTNDTLKLDAATAIMNPGSAWPAQVANNQASNYFGTVVVSGNPIQFHAAPGGVIYTASASGATRTWTATALTFPAIPATIGAVSGLAIAGHTMWNGSLSTPVYWAIVRNTTTLYVAKYASGAWSIVLTDIFGSYVSGGNGNRGDTRYICYLDGCSVLTEGGKWLAPFAIPYVGRTGFYVSTVNTSANTVGYSDWSAWNSPTAGGVGEYTGAGGYDSASFGYTTQLGYYQMRTNNTYSAMYIISSRDIRGVGAARTEDDWINNTLPRYEVWVSCESATGLVAYLSEYPVFLGGYYTKVPTTSITLAPSTTNYVYATKDPGDRTTVNITTSTSVLPNSFSRMMIASIVTNATNIVSSTTYSFDGIGLPSEVGFTGAFLRTDGTTKYWSNDVGANHVVTGSLVNTGAYAIFNRGITASASWSTIATIAKASTSSQIVPHRFKFEVCVIENQCWTPYELYGYFNDRSNVAPDFFADLYDLSVQKPAGDFQFASAQTEFRLTNNGVANGPLYLQVRNQTYNPVIQIYSAFCSTNFAFWTFS